jgi:N-acetylglutamate synthase-like GNAT family acetyltransferase
MIIRQAREEDIETCFNLQKSKEFKIPQGGYSNKKFFRENIGNDYFLVVEDNKKIIGFLLASPVKANGAIIFYLVVDNSFRSKGIGTKFLKKFELICKKNNIKWIVAYSANNKDTLNFYKKNKYGIGTTNIEVAKDL